jgi:protein subunit release factor A
MTRSKRLLFSVTAKDFDRQTFSVGGHGGGGKDTSNSGVRLIHRASGAVGEGRDHRSNTRNARDAFERCASTDRFQKWLKIEIARKMNQRVAETPEEIRVRVNEMVDQGLKDGTIQVEEYAIA